MYLSRAGSSYLRSPGREQRKAHSAERRAPAVPLKDRRAPSVLLEDRCARGALLLREEISCLIPQVPKTFGTLLKRSGPLAATRYWKNVQGTCAAKGLDEGTERKASRRAAETQRGRKERKGLRKAGSKEGRKQERKKEEGGE